MKPKFVLKVGLFSCFLGSISACVSPGLSLQSIYQSNNCGIANKALRSIETPSELATWMQTLPRGFSDKPIQIPDIDFKKQTLILFALGQKPSSGYGIEQYASMAFIKDKTLQLPIRTQPPAVGTKQAQVITSPCQLFVIPRAKFSTLVAVDQPLK